MKTTWQQRWAIPDSPKKIGALITRLLALVGLIVILGAMRTDPPAGCHYVAAGNAEAPYETETVCP